MHYFQQILRDLHIKHTVPYARSLFDERQNSNSFLGIKQMLEHYGLKINAIHIQSEQDLEYPCVCLYDGVFRVLDSAPEDFSRIRAGTALIITDRGAASEPHYFLHRVQIAIRFLLPVVAVAAMIFLVVLSFLQSGSDPFDWHKFALFILGCSGAYFSWKTVAKECSGSCHDVLGSSASKLLGIFSLSVIGLSYFITGLIIELFVPSLRDIQAIISCIALIMPVWSLSYQAFVLRAWCRNCVGVQLSLILIFAAELLLGHINPRLIALLPALEAISLYIIIFFICNRIYELAAMQKKYPKDLVANYLELLKDSSTMEKTIAAGKKYDTTDASTLVIANPEAEKELLILISPFCEHCKVLFLNLKEKISSAVLNEYRIKIIFADEPAGLPVSGAAICEYYLHGPQGFIDFMSKWYTGSHSIVKYRKQFAGYKLSTEYNEELARQKEWIRSHNISGTPMMFVESHRISFVLLESLIQQNN